jgi:2-methylisocitrate lyase-like PEP mutase family enzyme
MNASIEEKRLAFAELHKGPGCFIMPNPWDVGGAIYLSSLGFKALATTSRGAAFAAGRPDGGLKRQEALDLCRQSRYSGGECKALRRNRRRRPVD